jgi:hypothetical protein
MDSCSGEVRRRERNVNFGKESDCRRGIWLKGRNVNRY